MKRGWQSGLVGLAWIVLAGTAQAQQSVCSECPSSVHSDPQIGADAAEILAYPTPDVVPLLPNETALYDRLYQRVTAPTDIYDAPGGAVTGGLAAGFNFVTSMGVSGDYTLVNDSQWLPTALLQAVLPSRYAGVLLPDTPLPYPMAWVLVNAVPSRAPGEEPQSGDLPLLRYTRVNLYDHITIGDWVWYQVGVDQWLHQTQIARVLPVERTPEIDTERWVSVDLYEQVAIAYEGEQPVFATLVSSGLADWPTREGLFHVYVRYPRTRMSGAEGQADFYYLEEVPWTMYFDGDIGLHGTYWHDGFGYRHSHGCVNLSITDSQWLYEWASPEFDFTIPGDTGIAVLVYSSGEYRSRGA